jgi:transposase
MAQAADHLSVEALGELYRSARDGTTARHAQVIWLLAQGHTVPEAAAATSFVARWIEQLLARYNAAGPAALGDQRRGNGRAPTVLTPAVLERLAARLATPPPDGGVWTSRKAAAFLAAALGLEALPAQRGWEALRAIRWSVQAPRPRHPAAAGPEEAAAFKKSSPRPWPRRPRGTRARSSRCSPPTSTASA